METANTKKVLFVKQVQLPINTKKDSENNLDTHEMLGSLLKEFDLSETKEEVIPSRDLKKIKHEYNAKKIAKLVELNSAGTDHITDDDLKSLNPSSKLEILENEFFHAKHQLLKNIRLMENLKSQMFKLYHELYPDLSVEEIREKFTY